MTIARRKEMKNSGSYDASASHRDTEAEIERLRAQALLGWEKEARTLTWFGLRDGMSILELGSGPGFATEQLLDLLPSSAVTALEIDSGLLKKAESHLGHWTVERLRFVEASIMDTGLPDDSFDFAFARLIFQHLPDPDGAAREVYRVLKPGGKLVISDIDDAVWGIADPNIPEMGRLLQTYARAQAAQGGNRYVGRRLWRILEGSGFANLDLEAIATHSDASGITAFDPQMDPDRLLPLAKAGWVSEEEIQQFRASRDVFLASPGPYVMMLGLMACGEKP
jgi:ubiquinone/menaquinone biosynthesis C-methylase UbiE